MSTTFVLCLVIALAAVAFWRQTLVILAAVVIALLASGASSVAQAITGEHAPPSAVAPIEPGLPAGPAPPSGPTR